MNPIVRRLLASAEKQTGESSDWLVDMYGRSRAAFWKFGLFQPMAKHRSAVPVGPWFAARIAAVLAEDCGPCLQTVVNFATAEGVDPDLLRAAVRGDVDAMDADAALAYRFAQAVVDHDPEAANLREEAERRWGKAATVDLAFAIVTTRVYPMLKRGLGYGEACQRVSIAGECLRAGHSELAVAR